jgi:L-lactate dehydrogenase complex protein LldE
MSTTPVRAALFPTCLAESFFAEAAADAVRLLRHLGVEVTYPKGQTCCGQPAYNAGHVAEARRAARHTSSVFADAEYVVLPSGSCAGMLRSGFPKLLGASADDLSSRTFELSQFIVQVLGVESLGRGLTGTRIAYHHSCHALRELGVDADPVSLLRNAGATVVEWEADRECCGFGGLFSVKHPEVSAAMADRKLDTLPEVDFVTSTDGGCLMQMSGRAGKRTVGRAEQRTPGAAGPQRLTTPFRHVASVLWEAVGPAQESPHASRETTRP